MKHLIITLFFALFSTTAFTAIPNDIMPPQMPFKILDNQVEEATEQLSEEIEAVTTDISCPTGEYLIGITYDTNNTPIGICTSGGATNRVFIQQQFISTNAGDAAFGRVDCPQGYKVIRHAVAADNTSTVLNYHRLVDGDLNLAGFVVGGGKHLDPQGFAEIEISVTCESL